MPNAAPAARSALPANTWPKDTQAARNAFYGDPAKNQIASQLVPVVPPFAMYYEGKRVKAIQFHRRAAPALLAADRKSVV